MGTSCAPGRTPGAPSPGRGAANPMIPQPMTPHLELVIEVSGAPGLAPLADRSRAVHGHLRSLDPARGLRRVFARLRRDVLVEPGGYLHRAVPESVARRRRRIWRRRARRSSWPARDAGRDRDVRGTGLWSCV